MQANRKVADIRTEHARLAGEEATSESSVAERGRDRVDGLDDKRGCVPFFIF